MIFCAVYGVEGSDVLFVLQRAPCVSAADAEQSFARELWIFLRDSVCARVVLLLCGASLQALQDDQVLRR